MNAYTQITYEQRCQIYALKDMGCRQQSMADTVGVSQSAISRELKRNTGDRGYRYNQAQSKAGERRLFLEAVLWIARTAAPWRDLPESFAHWHRVYVRYNRWSHNKGVWKRVFAAVIDDPGFECLMIDGSIVRVHQHGAAKKEEQAREAEGRSGRCTY